MSATRRSRTIDKSDVTARGAAWFYSLLWKADDMRARAPIVQTVVFTNGTAKAWLCSDDAGMVTRRARLNDPVEVADRFRSQAMISKANMDGAIAVLRMQDGSSRTIGEDELEGTMASWPNSRSLIGGDGTVYRCRFSLVTGPDGQLQPQFETQRRQQYFDFLPASEADDLAAVSRHADVNRQLQQLTVGIARHLEMASAGAHGSLRVMSLELDWVFDSGVGGGSCWLLWPHSVETSSGLGPVRGGGRRIEGSDHEEGKTSGWGRDGPLREGKEAEDTTGRGRGAGRGQGVDAVDGALYTRARHMEATRAADHAAQVKYDSLCSQPAGDGWRGRVLLADGDIHGVVTAADALIGEGYRVMACPSGPKALELTRHQPFDALLLSTELPGLSGVDVTRVLREREQGLGGAGGDVDGLPVLRLPVLAFTSATAPEDLREYMECGMDGCVVKPLEMETLLSTIAAAVPPPEEGPPPAIVEARTQELAKSMRSASTRRSIAEEETRRTIAPGMGGMGGTAITPFRGSGGVGGVPPVSPVEAPFGGASFLESTRRAPRSGRLQPIGSPGRRSSGGRGPPPAAGKGALTLPVSGGGGAKATGAGGVSTEESHGMFQLDAETAVPYTVLGKTRDGAPLFNFVVCQDLFDTCESHQIFFRAICAKYPGLRVLLFNYPGQAFTEWRRDALLNNEYLAGVLQALLVHTSAAGTNEFGLQGGSAPFYLMGYGFGGAVASFFASRYHGAHPNMRGLLLVNGATYVDAHLAGVLHDCMNVFACSPPSRPDLPVYFFSRFLFSPQYLGKVGAPLALNLYTAVNNPISLEGRVQLCQGALSAIDCRDALEAMPVPVVAVACSRDALIKPTQVQALVAARGGEERSLKRALKARKRVCVIWLRSGHEVWQEARRPMTHLIEQLATGYHEKHDVAFLPLAADHDDVKGGGSLAVAAAEQGSHYAARRQEAGLAGNAADRARARASALGADMHSGATQSDAAAGQIGNVPGQPRMYEDRYIDSVVGAVRAARASDGTVTGGPTGLLQLEDAPAALAAPPAVPSGLLKGTKKARAPNGSAVPNSSGAMVSHGGASPSTRRRDESKSLALSMSLDPEMAAFDNKDKAQAAAEGGQQMAKGDKAPVVKEFMAWRVRRNRKRLLRIEACAVQIQRCWRAYLARTLVARMRQQRAAMTLQRFWRGCLGRFAAEERRREIWAARVVQRYWRGFHGRSMAWRLRTEEQAVRAIQRVWRGWRATRFVRLLKETRRQSAVKVQAMWRRRAAVRRAWQMRDQNNAAVNIQRVFRGYLGRCRARRERDRYLFSKSQAQGIEFGRQMLLEHRLHGTKLQSEVALLTKEKLETEEQVEAVLAEIATFESGVRALEKEMTELSRAEAEAAGTLDEESKAELRENKMRLDREFGQMLVRIADRREKLQSLERKLQALDRARQGKKEELADLERKLVVLLEEQQRELRSIKQRQAKRGEQLVEDAVDAVTSEFAKGRAGAPRLENGQAATGGGRQLQLANGRGGGEVPTLVPLSGGGGGNGSGPTPQQRAEANALMASTETMMKFGFMSMSLTYFSSLNMIRAMRKVGAANTVLSAPALGGPGGGAAGLLAAMAGGGGGVNPLAALAGGGQLPQLPPAALGATSSTFAPPSALTASGAGRMGGGSGDVSLWTVSDVSSWLDTLALGQYRDAFADAAVDGAFLFDLTDDDLRSTLGIEHALHRKKILGAVRRLKNEHDTSHNGQQAQPRSTVGGVGSGAGTGPGRGASEGASGPMQSAPSSGAGGGGGDPGTGSESDQAGALRLPDLMSWVRHNKGRKLSEALRPLRDQRFERASVKHAYVPGFGTQYDDAVAQQPFHVNQADDHGNCLLIVSAQNGNQKLAQLLIRKGANVDHQNNAGNTALHYAMAYDYHELGEWLADPDGGQADDTVLNSDGQGPYDGIA